MAKKAKEIDAGFGSLLSLVIWITGILVSLAVGFGMIDGTLGVRFIAPIITAIAGWVVVILTLLGVLIAIIEKVR